MSTRKLANQPSARPRFWRWMGLGSRPIKRVTAVSAPLHLLPAILRGDVAAELRTEKAAADVAVSNSRRGCQRLPLNCMTCPFEGG